MALPGFDRQGYLPPGLHAAPLWSPELRKDVVEGIEAQMRKIEREIAECLAGRVARVA